MKKLLCILFVTLSCSALTQTSEVEKLEQAAALNKKVLAQYTWQEVMTLSLDGEMKKTKVSSVEIGSDGKPKKTLVSETDAPKKDVRGPLRKRIAGRKIEEFKDYIKAVVELAHQYAQPDPAKLKSAIKEGNIKRDASPGAGLVQFTIANYIKSGDSMTIVVDVKKKHMTSVKVSSYLDDPKDKVSIDASFAGFSDEGSHLEQGTITGESKKLQIQITNSDYKKR
jgi:hypothetical protein